MTYHVTAIGGTTFEIVELGLRFESGEIDADGQWVETEDLDDAARDAADLPRDAEIELPF